MPTVLIVAGSDSSCGAGISADLETVRSRGCDPLLAITSVTAQNDESFLASHPVPSIILRSQLEAVRQLAVDGIDAVKVGMLPNEESVEVLCDFLEAESFGNVVVDPVRSSSSGAPLASEAAFSHMMKRLLPLASIVTPNLPEARLLSEDARSEEKGVQELAEMILGHGSDYVLIKGGHVEGNDCIDYLYGKGDSDGREFRHPRLAGGPFRGTGCRLSSGLAAGLALGDDVPRAMQNARTDLQDYLRASR